MTFRDDRARLEDILEALDRVREYRPATEEEFASDTMRQDAIIRRRRTSVRPRTVFLSRFGFALRIPHG